MTEMERLAEHMLTAEGEQVCRDMATHVADQVFDVCRRNGMMMKTAAGATGMLVLASVQVLAQADDFLRRSLADTGDGEAAITEDCSPALINLFVDELPSSLVAALRALSQQGETR